MKLLTTLLVAVVFACSAAVPALADDTCNPGNMQGPPCLSAMAVSGDSAAPGELGTPPAVGSVDYRTLAQMGLHALLLY